jgi:hypothetical protein
MVKWRVRQSIQSWSNNQCNLAISSLTANSAQVVANFRHFRQNPDIGGAAKLLFIKLLNNPIYLSALLLGQ